MQKLLSAIWPDTSIEGSITFWFRESGASVHVPLELLPDLDDVAVEELKEKFKGQNAYFGLGLRKPGLPSDKQGGQKQIVAMPGICIDIDFEDSEAHKTKKRLPRTEEEAYSIISHLPDPSAIVQTGHGWQIFWFFSLPEILDSASKRTQFQKAYKAFQENLVEQAENLGLHVDATTTTQRVWRLPGFANLKKGDASNIARVLHLDAECRYDAKSLLPLPEERASTIAKKYSSNIAEVIESLGRLHKEHQHKVAVTKILKGESFADTERDNAMQRVCSYIAWMRAAEGIDAEDLAEIFRSSMALWAAEPDAKKTLEEEMAKVVDKIKRAQQDKLEKKEKEREELQGLREFMKGREEEKEEEAPEFILNHAIIQKRTTFWVFDFREEKYIGPVIEKEFSACLRDTWANGPAGLRLDYINDKGEQKWKTIPALLREYATVAKDVYGILGLPKSYYDLESRFFYESLAPIREDLEPEFHEEIDTWLRLLGGNKPEKFLDWLAAVPMLEYQCCCCFIQGKSNVGKNFLSEALSSLWHTAGPTPLLKLMESSFNDEMFRCPLVYLDEGLPDNLKSNSANFLRSMIGSSTFTLNEKFVTTRFVQGSVRLLIGANNSNPFGNLGEDINSVEDLEAVVSRILHIKASPQAADYLEKNNEERKKTTEWRKNNRVARHVLWLRDNRDIKHGKRFIVEEEEIDDMHRKLLSGGVNDLVLEWLSRFATNPEPIYKAHKISKKVPLVQIGEDCLLINTQGLLDGWATYSEENSRKPTTAKIGRALTQISESDPVRKRVKGGKLRFHKIKIDLVIAWSIDNQIGDDEQIKLNLKKKLPT